MLKIRQNWGKIANYPPQCSTKICTTVYACTVVRKVLKETETEKTIVFFVTFLSLVAFQLRGGRAPWGPPGYAYVCIYIYILLLERAYVSFSEDGHLPFAIY